VPAADVEHRLESALSERAQYNERVQLIGMIVGLAAFLPLAVAPSPPARCDSEGRDRRRAAPTLPGTRGIDVHLPTTDGRELLLSRYTEPEPELNLLLKKLKLELPAQPPPKSPLRPRRRARCSADLWGSTSVPP
jgi:hypothetical protein